MVGLSFADKDEIRFLSFELIRFALCLLLSTGIIGLRSLLDTRCRVKQVEDRGIFGIASIMVLFIFSLPLPSTITARIVSRLLLSRRI